LKSLTSVGEYNKELTTRTINISINPSNATYIDNAVWKYEGDIINDEEVYY
jgi:hypothetical protein